MIFDAATAKFPVINDTASIAAVDTATVAAADVADHDVTTAAPAQPTANTLETDHHSCQHSHRHLLGLLHNNYDNNTVV